MGAALYMPQTDTSVNKLRHKQTQESPQVQNNMVITEGGAKIYQHGGSLDDRPSLSILELG